MQRRAGLSPDGRAGPSMARSTAPVPLRSRRAFPLSPAGGGCGRAESPLLSNTAGSGAGLGAAPLPGAGPGAAAAPERAAGHRPEKRDTRNAREASSPRAGLSVPRARLRQRDRAFPRLGWDSKAHKPGAGPAGARRRRRRALGLREPRGSARRAAGRGVRPGGSAAHSRCHNLLPRLLGVPFDSVVWGASRGRTGSCRRQPSSPG